MTPLLYGRRLRVFAMSSGGGRKKGRLRTNDSNNRCSIYKAFSRSADDDAHGASRR